MGQIGENYATITELRSYLSGLEDTAGDIHRTELESALDSASEEIERHCKRQFNRQETATDRVFDALSSTLVYVDDFYSRTGLVIKSGPNFSITWEATDYVLKPLNGICDGQPGWPFYKIEVPSRGRFRFDDNGVQITAKWGWAAVPAAVRQAALIMAAENFNLKDATFGVAGADQFGTVLRVKDNKIAAGKLKWYTRGVF